MAFEKQTIVPKTEGAGIRFDVIGDYSLTLGEVLYLVMSILFLTVQWFYIPILWLQILITILIIFTWLLFIPSGQIKLYNVLGKMFILWTTQNNINIIRPELEKTDKFILYKKEKVKMYYNVLELEMSSLQIEGESGITRAFDQFEKVLIRCDSLQWYLTKQVLSQDLEHNISYIRGHANNDNTNIEYMANEMANFVQDASNASFGRYYLILQSVSKNSLDKVSNNLLSSLDEFVSVKDIPLDQKERIILLQSDVHQEQNRVKFNLMNNKINNGYCEYLVLTNNRPIVDWFWLNQATHDIDIRYTITGQKKSAEHSIKQLNKQLTKIKTKINIGTSDHVRESEWNEQYESLSVTIDNLRGNEQSIYKSMTLVEVWAETPHLASQKAKRIRNDLRQNGVRFTIPLADGKDVYKIKSPLSLEKPKKSGLFKDMLSYTIAASWAFASVMLKDKEGMLLGYNQSGLSFWNPKLTKQDLNNDYLDRKNLNAIILGMSGSGKSVLTMKIVNHDIITGGVVWVVDPKDEDYFGMARMYNGEIFEFGLNDGKNKLNPFEIFGWKELTPKERKHEIVAHGEFLNGWLEILFEDKDFKNKIIKIVKEKYTGQENNDNLEWLTFSKVEKEFANHGIRYEESIDKFAILTSPEHFLNGQSNIEQIYEKDFVVFQTSNIFNSTSESMKNASLVMLTQLIQSKARKNKNTGKVFHAVIDEAHNFFRTKVGSVKINALVREARGWNAGLILISQNPQDFMGGDVMNNITTTFYGSLDVDTVNKLSETLSISKGQEGLNSTEKRFILEAKRGQFLVVINSSKKETLQVNITQNEFHAFDGTLEEEIKQIQITKGQYSEVEWEMMKTIKRLSDDELTTILEKEYPIEYINDFDRVEMIEAVMKLQVKQRDEEFDALITKMNECEIDDFIEEYNLYLGTDDEYLIEVFQDIAFQRFSKDEIEMIISKTTDEVIEEPLKNEDYNKKTKGELIEMLGNKSDVKNLSKMKKQELIDLLTQK